MDHVTLVQIHECVEQLQKNKYLDMFGKLEVLLHKESQVGVAALKYKFLVVTPNKTHNVLTLLMLKSNVVVYR